MGLGRRRRRKDRSTRIAFSPACLDHPLWSDRQRSIQEVSITKGKHGATAWTYKVRDFWGESHPPHGIEEDLPNYEIVSKRDSLYELGSWDEYPPKLKMGTWKFRAVVPGASGRPKPWYFPKGACHTLSDVPFLRHTLPNCMRHGRCLG